MVYLNGDNNLDSFGMQNIKSMEQVGSNDQVNIVVQWASIRAGKTVRMLIQKSKDSTKVTSPVVQDLGVVDMGDYHSLQDFIHWTVKNYPANHYFVDVWNHGSGWHSVKNGVVKRSHLFGDISWDDNSGHSIKTEELGQVINEAAQFIGHKVDIYGSDACLMAMIEVANEMANSVNYFVGSQEVEPGAGWPYADFLSRWQATPNATAEQVSKILVHAYVKSYQGGSNGNGQVTFSAFDMSKLDKLNQAIAKLGADIRQLNPADRKKIADAAESAQSFEVSDYADMLDFVGKIAISKKKDGITADLAQVKATAKEFILANEDTKSYAKATGLSIWLPTNRWTYDNMSTRYHGLRFDQATQWGDTLATLVAS